MTLPAAGATSHLVAACGSGEPAAPSLRDAGADVASAPADASSSGDAAIAPDAGPVTPPDPPLIDSCTGAAPFEGAWLSDPKMCLTVYARALGGARQTAFAPNGDLFVAIQGGAKVLALYDDDKDGVSGDAERSTFATAPGLNHGLAFSPDGKFVYASSPSSVFRWAYASGDRTATGPAQAVVKNMPTGGHDTRTLVFDSTGSLLINVGSSANVENNTASLLVRAQVRRFAIPATIPAGGIEYATGEVVSSGNRNEVGLFVDEQDHVWGVENGRDSLTDAAGNDIHDDNPAEELNWLDAPGARSYGYPYCWSEGRLDGGKGPGTQWAETVLPALLLKTDAWCRDLANVQPPVAAMPAHWAPLGIFKYTGTSLPFHGDFLVTSHGSSERTPPSGRVLARAAVKDGAITKISPIVGERAADGSLQEGTWSARPVDVRQGEDGAVYFSDDAQGRIFRLGYRPR